jgi:carboxypeptidase Taq
MLSAYEQFQTHIGELHDLLCAISVLKWDARTMMPRGGAQSRGQQLATLTRHAQEHFLSPHFERILHAVEAEVSDENPDSYRVRSVHQTRQAYDLLRRIPLELVTDKAAIEPVAEQVWAEAKAANDFNHFAPFLERQVELARAQAEAIGYDEHPYDALIQEFDPGMTAREVRRIFDKLKTGLLPLLQQITARGNEPEPTLWQQSYPLDAQKAFALDVAQDFGYDLDRGRLDVTAHPFAISFTREDVRITNRYDEHFWPKAFFSTLHETGHALYEQYIDPALTRTALTIDFLGKYPMGGTSSAVHESQSRLWENLIGRSHTFWQVYFPRLQSYFPQQFASTTADQLYRAVNRVQPSLIRVEADEITYNLHIMLRVELELGLLDGSIRVADLPEVWRVKMQEYLGIVPPTDTLGCLQDVHWASGAFGSFASYTLGNILSAQFFLAALQSQPEIEAGLRRGEYHLLLEWLTEHIYEHGRAYPMQELLPRATGHGLTVEPYLAYLHAKFGGLYGL